MLVRQAQVVQVGTTAGGVPRSLVWDGVRYRVSDRPTRWGGRGDAWDFGPDPEAILPAGVDAADADVSGGACVSGDPRVSGGAGASWGLALWRFQATPVDDGPSLVVDLICADGGWVLLGVVR